jgi:hypothetical protein
MTDDETPDGVETVDGLDLDPRRLPEQFRHLVPLIRRWAVGDDVERSDREEAASTEELRQLYGAFLPLFGAIDVWFRSVDVGDGSCPDEALLLDSAALAAAEARVTLQRRGEQV